MRRARTRKERREREKRAARTRRLGAIGAIIAVCAVGASLPGVLIWREIAKAEVIVDASGCSPNAKPIHLVLLIDQTDAVDPQWRAYIQQVIPALARDPGLPTFGRLSVFGLTDQRDAPLQEILSECKPPSPETDSFLFDTRAQRAANEARYEQFYDDRIEAAARAAEASGPREASPILEGLLALQDHLIEVSADRTELIVVSDMMQYTPEYPRFSHYGGYPSFADFAATNQGSALTAFLPLDAVTVHYVRRPSLTEHQTEPHAGFWRDYFSHAGVAEITWNDDPLTALAGLPEGE